MSSSQRPIRPAVKSIEVETFQPTSAAFQTSGEKYIYFVTVLKLIFHVSNQLTAAELIKNKYFYFYYFMYIRTHLCVVFFLLWLEHILLIYLYFYFRKNIWALLPPVHTGDLVTFFFSCNQMRIFLIIPT